MTRQLVSPVLETGSAPVAVRDMLCLTDLSTLSARALEHARFLAEHFDAELTVYHAVEKFDHPAYLTFGHGDDLTREAERLARALLQRLVVDVRARCAVKVEPVSDVASAVVEMVNGRRADLTVMATHGRRGLGHLLLGSIAETVLQRVHTPVLCLRDTPPRPYRKILVPTDLSVASRVAFPLAAFLAAQFEAEVVALHVVAPPTMATLSGIPAPLPPVPREEELWQFCQGDFPAVRFAAQIGAGTAWDRIVQTAQTEKADLIVMATCGHDSLADRVLGTHTERVLRHAPCPVLVA